jgi:catechol 2,3-dioxygenase-like lactoylglutathione lyase family enzyme
MSLAIRNLPAVDLNAARRFYVDRLGFKVIFDSSDGGAEGLVGLERDGMRINIDAPMDGHGRKACVTLEVDNIEALHAEWIKALNLDEPLIDQPWGARPFGFQDPDDNTVFVLGNVGW